MSANKSEQERLRAMLTEDTGSPDEAEALLGTITQLRQWHAPEPSAERMNSLMAMLAPYLPRLSRRERFARWLQNCWPLLVLRAQMRVVRREIWLVSLLVITLGTFVTLNSANSEASSLSLPLIIVAPLVTAFCVAFVYGPEVDPPLEMLLATPVPAQMILLARLALIFGFNLLLGLMGSIVLAALSSDMSLWPLIMAWLAPMAFLSALAFGISVATREPMVGGLVSLVLWTLQVVGHENFNLRDLTTPSAQPWMLLTAALIAWLAIRVASSEAHWVGKSNENRG